MVSSKSIAFAMIYYFIFKLVMRVQIPNYTVFLITGLFPWQWFASSATNSLFSFIANAQIIKKTVFPRSVIPLSNVMMEGLHFLCTIPVIVVFLFCLWHDAVLVLGLGYTSHCYWPGDFHLWCFNHLFNAEPVFP